MEKFHLICTLFKMRLFSPRSLAVFFDMLVLISLIRPPGVQTQGFCSFNLCRNGATCFDIDMMTGYCECEEGFTGADCGLTDFCVHGLCQNGSTCVNTETSGYCICTEGFTGAACDVEVDTPGFCTLGYCQNGATCIETANGGSCLCAEGFTGVTCGGSQGLDQCQGVLCLNSGQCQSVTNTFLCICSTQWTGQFCEIPRNSGLLPGMITPTTIQVLWQDLPSDIDFYRLTVLTPQAEQTYDIPQTQAVGGRVVFTIPDLDPNTVYPITLDAIINGEPFDIGSISPTTASPCMDNPCRNGGACNTAANTAEGYVCLCQRGYEGVNCELVNTPPSIPACPTVPPVTSLPENVGNLVTWTIADCTDEEDGNITSECDPMSNTFFNVGVNPVTCTCTDTLGVSTECTFDVVIAGGKTENSDITVIIMAVSGVVLMIGVTCSSVSLFYCLCKNRSPAKERQPGKKEQPEPEVTYSRRIDKDYTDINGDRGQEYCAINSVGVEPDHSYQALDVENNPQKA